MRFVIKEGYDCCYGRVSKYIADTERGDAMVLILDPSEDEYAEAIAEDSPYLKLILDLLNNYTTKRMPV